MDTYFLLYFLGGLVQDVLLTLNIRFIAKDKVWSAVISSFIVTVVGMFVLYDLITRLDKERSLLAVLFYAGGIATGTLLAMKMKLGSKD